MNLMIAVTARPAPLASRPAGSSGDQYRTANLMQPPLAMANNVPTPKVDAQPSAEWSSAIRKARAFVNQLDLEELVNLTTGQGAHGRCIGQTGDVTRLNFTGICFQDSPLGVRSTDGVSAFPAAINVAATWDKDLMYMRGAAMGSEFRGKVSGVNVALSPMMNLARTPEAGRNWEGFGGDPYLAGFGAAMTIKGIQSTGVIACAKHYIANEQEHYRGGSGAITSSSNIDDRVMHEVYNHPFSESIRAGVGAIMCSYNRINQTHACENSYLMNKLAKQDLAFHGFVVSDWAAQTSGVSSALAGLDMSMPGFRSYTEGLDNQQNPAKSNTSYWGAELVKAVNNGSVPLARVKDAVTRSMFISSAFPESGEDPRRAVLTPSPALIPCAAMAAYYQLGQDSKDYPDINFSAFTLDTYDSNRRLVNSHVNVSSDHNKLVREIGAASNILLKNVANALPLKAGQLKSVGIFGADAGPAKNGPNEFPDRSGLDGTLAMGWGSGTVNFPYLVDPLSAIRYKLGQTNPKTSISSVLDNNATSAIQRLARLVEKCLVFVASDSGEGYLTVNNNQGDRNDLELWQNGNQLISKVASLCSDVIVVIHSVGAIDMESWIDNKNITAVVLAGLPGQESGNSLVDVLFGDVNPSGRLPYTIGKKRSDYAADVLYKSSMAVPQITYSEGLFIDYRWFDAKSIAPRFEFGFGLSYTTFRYSALSVTALSQGGSTTKSNLYHDFYCITYQVTNRGPVDGAEVSQVYLAFPPSAQEPPKVLRDFARTFLKNRTGSTVTIKLNRKAFSIWDVALQSWKVPKGDFTVFVGASSRDIRLRSAIVNPSAS
ncbi:BZ3500_MvSof-1268-A1-R1_Chr7-3g09643 [Microbotryum saponariae]|uniref:beta-glucosidase n=1 Tax=Microbotryum saponariae TaxID=289078 RepID=A0A2X0L6M6_9BASI|nr:BZ3501_MvSof-1269-A2-R1_Chr7-2g09366 [Microbotryum saponariae]SDA02334.1 BZ3500_MvSof-1268-A1-R1_Chr7-3g09643 [Microbotryum saponariae]